MRRRARESTYVYVLACWNERIRLKVPIFLALPNWWRYVFQCRRYKQQLPRRKKRGIPKDKKSTERERHSFSRCSFSSNANEIAIQNSTRIVALWLFCFTLLCLNAWDDLKTALAWVASLNFAFDGIKLQRVENFWTESGVIFDSWINTSLCYNLNVEEFQWMMMISAFHFSTRYHFSIIHAAAIFVAPFSFRPAFYNGHHVVSLILALFYTNFLSDSCLVNFSRYRQSSSGHCQPTSHQMNGCVTETDENTKWDKININIQNHMKPKHKA